MNANRYVAGTLGSAELAPKPCAPGAPGHTEYAAYIGQATVPMAPLVVALGPTYNQSSADVHLASSLIRRPATLFMSRNIPPAVRCWSALFAFALGCATVWSSADADEQPADQAKTQVSFSRQIAPVLVRHCISCHGPKKPEGEFQLHTFARLMKGGASGEPPVAAGKPDESYLVELITSDDADVRMPKEQKPLAADEIELLRRWIAEGAAFDGPDSAAPLESIVPKLPQPRPPDVYPRPVPVTALAFSPDGSTLASGGYHEVLLWGVMPSATGSASVADQQEAPGSAGGSSSNGSSGNTSTPGRSPGLKGQSPGLRAAERVSPLTLVRRIQNIAQRTHAIAFNEDGSLMAVAAGTPGRVGEVKLFNPKTGELVADLGTMADEVFDVEFSRHGARLAACGADRTIRVYDVAERKELRRIEAHADWVMAIAWSPDGTSLASASRDKTAKVIDAATGTVLVTYPGHDEQVYDVLFAADGEHVFSAGRGRELHRWAADGKSTSKSDVRKKETGAIVGRTQGEIYKLALQGSHVLAASADGKVSQFDPQKMNTHEPTMVYQGAPPQGFALAHDEPTKRIAVGGFDGRVMMYEVGDPAPWQVLVPAPGFVKK